MYSQFSDMSYLYNAVFAVAVLFFAKKVFDSLYRLFYPFFLATPCDLKALAGSSWAVVTGSTDGIGKAYAIGLAKRGFNLLLISRSEEKLNAVSSEIRILALGIDVRTITFDFVTANVSDYEEKIFAVLRDYEIGLLGQWILKDKSL